MSMAEDLFKTERDLCAGFIDAVNRRDERLGKWTVYPETCGFDIVLVRDSDGFQIGIEAKLRLNAKVVAQALPSGWTMAGTGPDCRAILIPKRKCNHDLKAVCEYVGVTIITVEQKKGFDRMTMGYGPLFHDDDRTKPVLRIDPELPRLDVSETLFRSWYEWAPDERLALPEVVPDCDAGCPSPLKLTPWKIKAIKIVVLLERTGYVTRKDFKDLNINPTLWTNGNGWLIASGKDGRHTTYVAGENIPDLRVQHPRNFDEIAALSDEWWPENRKENTKQDTML